LGNGVKFRKGLLTHVKGHSLEYTSEKFYKGINMLQEVGYKIDKEYLKIIQENKEVIYKGELNEEYKKIISDPLKMGQLDNKEKEIIKGLKLDIKAQKAAMVNKETFKKEEDISSIRSVYLKLQKELSEYTKKVKSKLKSEFNKRYFLEKGIKSRYRDYETTLCLAEEVKEDTLYFVINVDFRGRIYTVGDYLNYQGNKLGRSLLSFEQSSTWNER